MSNYLVVTTTVPNKTIAKQIAQLLLTRQLAACVQIVGPMESHYWWENELQQSEEYLCIAKTSKALYAQIETLILENHPYVTPEVFATPITQCTNQYQLWIDRYTATPVK